MYRRMSLLFFVMFSLFFSLNNLTASDETLIKSVSLEKEEYLSEELPSIVIAYSLFCARYDAFKSLESNPTNVLIKLGRNIDALPGGISTGLGFTRRAFIVHNNIVGHLSGFARGKNKTLEESNVPFESILFVTTPIKSFGDRALLILSSVSPEKTTIMAVDNKLNTELLYDSFNKNYFDSKKTTMGSIYGVKVMKPGYLELQERMEPGARGFSSSYKNRSFMIDVTKGIFEISMKQERGKQ